MNFWDILLADKLDGKDIPPHSYQLQEFESTGQTTTFTASALPMPTLSTDIVASQDLHGYDKPWAGGEGKNKLPLVLSDIKTLNTSGTWTDDTYAINGVEIEIESDSGGNVVGIATTGTATSDIYFVVAVITENGTFKMLGCPSGGDFENTYAVYQQRNPGGAITYDSGQGTEIEARVDDDIRIVLRSGATVDNVLFKPMITTDTTATYDDFEPYSNICPISGTDTIDIDVAGGESYTIDLDGTRYGGQLDVVSGVLTLTHGYVVLSKDDGWSLNDAAPHSFRCSKNLGMVEMWDGITRQYGISNCSICDGNTAYWGIGSAFAYSSGDNALYVANPNCTSLDDFKTFLDSLSYEICGKLITPQTIKLTPTQVWAVQGGNTITTTGQGLRGSYFKAI